MRRVVCNKVFVQLVVAMWFLVQFQLRTRIRSRLFSAMPANKIIVPNMYKRRPSASSGPMKAPASSVLRAMDPQELPEDISSWWVHGYFSEEQINKYLKHDDVYQIRGWHDYRCGRFIKKTIPDHDEDGTHTFKFVAFAKMRHTLVAKG